MDIKTVNTILYCQKWHEAVSFYQTKLKLPITAAFDWFVEFEINETSRLSIANEERTSMTSTRGNGHTITMKVTDIQEIYSELKQAGLNPSAIRAHKWGAKIIYLYDPEGNRLEFWSENV
jgi:predicted enzyme related to lactoylglutathione lyase